MSISKCQGSVIDIVVAFMVFSSVFLINHYSWSNISIKINNNFNDYYFKSSVYQAVDSLVKTSGYPVNWESNVSSALSIGLVNCDNVIDYDKLIALNNSYDLLKDLVLSTGDWRLIIKNNSVTLFTIGVELNSSVIRVERLVLINNSFYKLIFMGGAE